jgi:hypothetical protein
VYPLRNYSVPILKPDSNYEAKKQLMVLKTIMPGAVEKHYAIGESLYPTIPPSVHIARLSLIR